MISVATYDQVINLGLTRFVALFCKFLFRGRQVHLLVVIGRYEWSRHLLYNTEDFLILKKEDFMYGKKINDGGEMLFTSWEEV